MSDWITMVTEISADKRRAGVAELDPIKRAIVDAISTISREERFWEQERSFAFATQEDVWRYDIPSLVDIASTGYKIISISGADLHYLEQVDSVWQSLEIASRVTADEVERAQFAALQFDIPEIWAVRGDELLLYPGTDDTTHRLRVLAIVEPGTPTKVYTGGAWSFKKPDGTAMSDTYTSFWFQEGYQMVRAYAEYLLNTQYWAGSTTQVDAQRAMARYQAHRRALAAFTHARSGPTEVVPYGLGIC